MIADALRRALLWAPAFLLAVTAATLAAVPGNTILFLVEASLPVLPWIRP